ncbi:MAG: DUF971 family protein [Oleiphilaceae bacterium]|jgi:DUF971 family protein
MAQAIPKQIKIKMGSSCLELTYEGEPLHELSFEFLRVFSPSAEVKGHGEGNEVLQFGKKLVTIKLVEPAGNYAIKITFSDHHDSGLYSWPLLYQFCQEKEQLWQQYLAKLSAAGKSREPSDTESNP